MRRFFRRLCKYACHKGCEPQVSSGCRRHQMDVQDGPVSASDFRQQSVKPVPRTRPPGGWSCREDSSGGMELHFVAQRVMALCFRPGIDTDTYRANLQQVAHMLHTKHAQNFMVFNLSEPSRDLSMQQWRLSEYGWPEGLAPPLDRLCSLCKSIDTWISSSPQHVAVLHARASNHDRGGWERMGVVVSAYIHYSNICRSPEQALDRFAMKKFFDDKIRSLEQPSLKRYVNYFAGLLSGMIEINSCPLQLHHLVLVGSPQLAASGGCSCYVRVYQGMVPVWTSGIHQVRQRAKYTVFSPDVSLQLRGDVLIKCYHCDPTGDRRQTVFRLQFHTCAVTDTVLSFTRHELDDACHDMRFPMDGGVELHFSATSLGEDQRSVPVAVDQRLHAFKRCNSYDSFYDGRHCTDGDSSVQHMEGPLDGSLYATVLKKPSSGSSAAPPGQLQAVSMDSGISSSCHKERLSAGSSGPAGSVQSGVSQLDELLSGMLQYCSNLPDLPASRATPPDIDGIETPRFGRTAPPPATSGSVERAPRARTASSSVSSGYQSLASSSTMYNGFSSNCAAESSFRTDGDIPYHARANSKPFSYLGDAVRGTRSPSPIRGTRSPSPGRRLESPDLEAPRIVEDMEQRRQALESPQLVRRLLVGGSPQPPRASPAHVSWSSGDSSRRSPSRGKENFRPHMQGDRSTSAKNAFNSELNQSSAAKSFSTPVKSLYSSTSKPSFTSTPNKWHSVTDGAVPNGILKSPSTESFQRHNGDTLKSGQTDTLRSNTSCNTDTLRSNKSFDWESTIRSPSREPPTPPPRSSESFRRRTPSSGDNTSLALALDPRDPNTKSVTTYDQNTNSRTTVSTQAFDMPCSPHPVRKIVETTKRFVVDNEANDITGITKLEETIREFVIEDVPDDGNPLAGSLTWLEKQQQKLRDRQQSQVRELRGPQEARMLRELQQRHCGMDENGGYTSDATTLWTTDTSREPSPAKCTSPVPLYTTPAPASSAQHRQARSSSVERTTTYSSQRSDSVGARPLARHRSESAYDRQKQRPHVQIRTPFEHHRTSSEHLRTSAEHHNQQSLTNGSTPAHLSTPVHENDGLLTTVNGSSGLTRLDGLTQRMVTFNLHSIDEVRDPPEPRPETPAFPNPPRTPYVNQHRPARSPTSHRKLLTVTQTTRTYSRSPSGDRDGSLSPVRVETATSFESCPGLQTRSRRSSSSDSDVITAHPLFVTDNSSWWYKPGITREQAISLLQDRPAGSFVIRDSSSFPGAFGLALKVSQAPAGAQQHELVRHFLIETTSRGVRLTSCPGEPTFGSLSALVYQHSVTPLALPHKLLLPDADLTTDAVDAARRGQQQPRTSALQAGAACNVMYLYTGDVEALTGPQAVKQAATQLFRQQPPPEGALVHFKVSDKGITLTDHQRKHFFRRHYNAATVSHCSLDPEERRWTTRSLDGKPSGSLRIFGFVAKKSASSGNNQCHLFCEYEEDQPASAIVNFVTQNMLSQDHIHH